MDGKATRRWKTKRGEIIKGGLAVSRDRMFAATKNGIYDVRFRSPRCTNSRFASANKNVSAFFAASELSSTITAFDKDAKFRITTNRSVTSGETSQANRITCALLLPDGKTVCVAGQSDRLQFVDVFTMWGRKAEVAHDDEVTGLQWLVSANDPKRFLVLSVSHDKSLQIWDPRNGKLRRTIQTSHSKMIESVATYLKDGLVATG